MYIHITPFNTALCNSSLKLHVSIDVDFISLVSQTIFKNVCDSPDEDRSVVVGGVTCICSHLYLSVE